jgi:cellulose synthase/poly-beta-1,6-N-acetylglucosamine synthase-like glycosyltransferase
MTIIDWLGLCLNHHAVAKNDFLTSLDPAEGLKTIPKMSAQILPRKFVSKSLGGRETIYFLLGKNLATLFLLLLSLFPSSFILSGQFPSLFSLFFFSLLTNEYFPWFSFTLAHIPYFIIAFCT